MFSVQLYKCKLMTVHFLLCSAIFYCNCNTCNTFTCILYKNYKMEEKKSFSYSKGVSCNESHLYFPPTIISFGFEGFCLQVLIQSATIAAKHLATGRTTMGTPVQKTCPPKWWIAHQKFIRFFSKQARSSAVQAPWAVRLWFMGIAVHPNPRLHSLRLQNTAINH